MVWLVVLVLALVCFVIGLVTAAKALFLLGLVLLVVAVAGGAGTRRRGVLGGTRGGLLGGRRSWRRRSLL